MAPQTCDGELEGMDVYQSKEKLNSGGFLKDSVFEEKSYMDTLFLSPHQWIKKKQDYDNIGNLWRIHDSLYDLTDYIDQHPGGEEWLNITKGTDITELFMSSHIINVNLVETILKNYYVKPADGPRKTPYTWKDDGFYMTLKKRAAPILKKVGTGSTLKMKLYQDVLNLGVIATSILATYYNSYLLMFLAGYILNLSTASAHNFLHTRKNWRKYYHDMSLIPSRDFQIFHVCSHHVYPNTRLDWEHVSAEPFFMFEHSNEKTWVQRYGVWFFCHPFMAIGLHYFWIYKMYRIFVQGEHSFRPENLILFLQMAGLCAIAPSITSGLISWWLIQASFSYWFIFIGYAATHHNTDCFHDGDMIRDNPDWGMCQMDATRDTRVDWSENMYVQATIYAEHPLHHMFPTVCLSKYKPLKSVFMDTMDEFGMHYPRYTRWESVKDTFNNYAKIAPSKFGLGDSAKMAN